MNDSQVKQQIQQMVSFIRQEAEEKAAEIGVKAEEDFNIRKLSTVEAAREKIRAEYERKTKLIQVNRKIAHSTELNGSRLKVLKARDEVLREVYDDADKRLARISTENPDVYKALLSSLILQSLLALRDEEVVVRTREADAAAVESALKTVSEEYTDKTDGAAINTVVDSKRFLSENCTGGVTLFTNGGRVMLENTFESRLEIAYQQNLPVIRSMLFGDDDAEAASA